MRCICRACGYRNDCYEAECARCGAPLDYGEQEGEPGGEAQ